MRAIKKVAVLLGVMAALTTASVTAYAASDYKTSAEAVAGITGRTVQDVTDERAETGKTYATIANEAGKLEDFQNAMLGMRKDYYSGLVTEGSITKQQADVAVATIESHHSSCDGTGYDSCLLYGTDHSHYSSGSYSSGSYSSGSYSGGNSSGNSYNTGGRHHNSGRGHRSGHH